MKKSLVLIPAILALTAFAGWRILQIQPPAPPTEEHEEHEGHGEHGEHEGEEHGKARVELSAEARKNARLGIAEAGPAKIQTTLPAYGKIVTNEEQTAHVMARFPGIARQVKARLGDSVKEGDVLAVIESNESLKTYEVKSELAGTIIEKHLARGEFVKEDAPIFQVADLRTVWVDLNIYREDFDKLQAGQPLLVHTDEHSEPVEARIDYISPFGAEGTQSMLARAVIPNPDGKLRPGLFVMAEIVTGDVEAKVAVKESAVQTLEEKPVVFVEEGNAFEAREVTLGARDREHVEILSGLAAGDRYAAEQSFLLKAELGKSEASHEH